MTDRARAAADHLHSAAIHLLRRLRGEDRTLGVGPAALSALSVLVFGGPHSLSALALAEGVRRPTMSRIVAGLVRAGLVRREADPDDRRTARLHPTARGRAVLRRGRARRVAALAALLATLDPSDVAHLDRAAGLIAAALGRPTAQPPDAG
jgi:DNA-binding MarR family transcriptional regulator